MDALRKLVIRNPDCALPLGDYVYFACGMTKGQREVPWLADVTLAAQDADLQVVDPRALPVGPILRAEWSECAASAIALYDYLLVGNSRCVVLDADHPSFGASHEAAYAKSLGRRVLAVAEERTSPFIDAHYQRVTPGHACLLLRAAREWVG